MGKLVDEHVARAPGFEQPMRKALGEQRLRVMDELLKRRATTSDASLKRLGGKSAKSR
jgi:hypothetical protein